MLNFYLFGLLVKTNAIQHDVCRMFYSTRLRKLSYERALVMHISIWQRHSLAHVSMCSTIVRLYIRDQYKEEKSSVHVAHYRYKMKVLGRYGVYLLCILSLSLSRLRDTLILFSLCGS